MQVENLIDTVQALEQDLVALQVIHMYIYIFIDITNNDCIIFDYLRGMCRKKNYVFLSSQYGKKHNLNFIIIMVKVYHW
jgi:hypothetical protein